MGVNRERIKLLAEALESGEYEQCWGALRIGDKYCCLGVACEVAIKNGLDIARQPPPHEGGADLFRYDGEPSVLPNSVRAWYGFPESSEFLNGAGNPMIDTEGFGRCAAAQANDEWGLSFPAIAAGFRNEYLTPA